MRNYPRISSLLALVSVSLLLLLLLVFWYLGVAQTNLVRQTERELNTQAAFVAAMYRDAYTKAQGYRFDRPFRVSESEVNWQPFDSELSYDQGTMLPEQPPPQAVATAKVDPREQQAGAALVRVLQDAQSKTLASIRVVNAAGVVISSTNLVSQMSLFDRREVQAALRGEHTAVLRKRRLTHDDPPAFSISRRADFRVHVAHPIFLEQQIIGAVVLARTPESIWQLLGRYKIQVGVILAIVLGFTWMLMVFTSHTIGQPIMALMEQAKRAQRGEKGAVTPLAHPVTYEINQLSLSVANMAQTLEARADFLMEYASHISHEFKSPVTALQGAIELLTDHGEAMNKVEYRRFLANMQGDVHRLHRLVIRLLDFAKADLKQSGGECCLLLRELQIVEQRYLREPITCHFDLQIAQDFSVKLSAEAVHSITSNLLDNALAAGAKNITLHARQLDHGLQIDCIDDGKPISSDNQQKIFEPFFTLNRKTGGTGLGLPIVQALLKHAGGHLTLEQTENGKCFTVSLPF